MINIRRIINSIVAVLMVGSLAVCAPAQDNTMGDTGEMREVFGIARATNQSNLPPTAEEWEVITDKIDNDQIDESVFVATFYEAWPAEYDKTEIRRKHFEAMIAPATTSDVLKGNATAPALPSNEKLNDIWLSMLEEIDQQRAKSNNTKD